MMCKSPVRIYKNLDLSKFPQGLEVPCGKCFACRLQRSAEWSTRLLHEMSEWEDSIFITLTYNNDNIPENGSLKKEHLQLFFKRLRKRLGKRRIKYYACGEYGSERFRPHYHIIIFGLGLIDKDIIKDSWNYCDWNLLSDSKSFKYLVKERIDYVSRYVIDKLSGELEEVIYNETGRENVFSLQSKGLGLKFLEENIEQIKQDSFVRVGKQKRKIPRYYVKKGQIDIKRISEYGIEKERSLVNDITGVSKTFDDFYLSELPNDVVRLNEKMNARRKQNDLNLIKKSQLRKKQGDF